MKKIKNLGIVISTSNTPNIYEFYFQFYNNSDFKENAYVQVKKSSKIFFGKIIELTTSNPIYRDSLFLDELMKQGLEASQFYSNRTISFAKVRVKGIIENNQFKLADTPIFPGDKVYPAPDSLIMRYLGLDDVGLHIGKLIPNENIKFRIDIDNFIQHHISILGTTGSGKSYVCGDLVEEYSIKREIPMVIIDTHGEYNSLTEILKLEKYKDFTFNIIAPKGSSILDKDFNSTNVNKIEFKFNPFITDSIFLSELINASDAQRDLIFLTLNEINGCKQMQKTLISKNINNNKENLNLNIFLRKIDESGQNNEFMRKTIDSIKRKIKMVYARKLIGKELDYKSLLRPKTITIIDVSEAYDYKIMRSIVAITLMKILKLKKVYKEFPIIILIEECHNFAPQEGAPPSKWIIRKIAREGRKFGTFLILTSQRLVGFDKDVLSQTNTKITLRIDSLTDINYVKPFLAFKDEKNYNKLPDLPNGVAFISGKCITSPTLIKIRERFTRHGGVTPSLKINKDDLCSILN